MKIKTIADNYVYVATARQADLPSNAVNVKQFREGAVFGIPAGSLIPAHWLDNLRNTRDRAMTDALDSGDKFPQWEGDWLREGRNAANGITDKPFEHAPGCGTHRNRPCNCEYLRSWNPGITIDNRGVVMRGLFIPAGGIKVIDGELRQTQVSMAATPQNRDAIRRAGLTKERTRGKPLSEEVIERMRASTEATKHQVEMTEAVNRSRDAWAMGSIVQGALRGHYPMPKGPLRSSAAAYLVENPALVGQLMVQRDDFLHRLVFWKRTAWFAVIIGATTSALAALQGVMG